MTDEDQWVAVDIDAINPEPGLEMPNQGPDITGAWTEHMARNWNNVWANLQGLSKAVTDCQAASREGLELVNQELSLIGGLRGQFIMCHSTDGALNAVGSSMEFQALMDARKSSSIRHYTCYAHQVNCSAKFALGTGDFVANENKEMSDVLKKYMK
jgi:uncharacterized protein YuzB (UPF0349 family)